MINIELQYLVKRLLPALKNTLEDAASECAKRGHLSIELEHWFIVLLQQSAGWQLAIEQAAMNKELIISQLN